MSSVIVGKKFKVDIVYNGVTKPLSVEPHEQVTAVVQQAAHLFGVTQNVHLLALFRTDGTEIAVNQSVAETGIRPDELLALRPSAVRGG